MERQGIFAGDDPFELARAALLDVSKLGAKRGDRVPCRLGLAAGQERPGVKPQDPRRTWGAGGGKLLAAHGQGSLRRPPCGQESCFLRFGALHGLPGDDATRCQRTEPCRIRGGAAQFGASSPMTKTRRSRKN